LVSIFSTGFTTVEVRVAKLTHIHKIPHVVEDASRNIYRVVETSPTEFLLSGLSPITDEERELPFVLFYRLDAFYGFPEN
jgi:hypothetical protein